MRLLRLTVVALFVGILTLGSASCAKAPISTPAPPASPQTTVALTNKTIADANLAAVKTVIALRDSGKLSQEDALNIQTWLALVANTSKGVGNILTKNESWGQQKAEIFALLATVTTPALTSNLDPGVQAAVTQIATLLAQLKVLVK